VTVYRRARPDSPDAVAILRDYFAEMVSRFHRRDATDAEVDAVMAENPSVDLALFLLAFPAAPAAQTDHVPRAGRTPPVGCVGLRLLAPPVAELKRMFVRPAFRGRGIGAGLLAAAERGARSLGATAVRLDTRHDLVEARGLYTGHGYVEIPAYNDGPYAEHWYEKRLD
jgi:GNAT superfamily N-acetyltransferase